MKENPFNDDRLVSFFFFESKKRVLEFLNKGFNSINLFQAVFLVFALEDMEMILLFFFLFFEEMPKKMREGKKKNKAKYGT